MKRWLPGVLSAAMLLSLSSTARAAITSCALDGLYVASSAVDAYPTDQASVLLTFTPPTTCSNGASGTVSVSGTLLQIDSPSPIPVSVTGAPYVVDEIGHLTIEFSDTFIDCTFLTCTSLRTRLLPIAEARGLRCVDI